MNAQERKQRPLYSGVLKYFGDALMEVAYVSFIGNEQHNPGTPLHWDRSKSGDELDACARHLKDAGKLDSDGTRHSAKLAWRALANLQKEIESERAGANTSTTETDEQAQDAAIDLATREVYLAWCGHIGPDPDRWGCSRPKGHKGLHAASDSEGRRLGVWE